MKQFRLFAIVVLVGLALLGIKATVFASGSEGSGGNYTNGSVTYYFNLRSVTNPSAPGAEVAYYLNTSSASGYLMLGSSHCGTTYDGPIYTQYYHNWQTVMLTSVPRDFCVVTYGNGRSGSFSGTIAWD